MTQIGEFTRTSTGFAGRIHTLSLKLDIAVVATAEHDAGNAPDYRLHAGSDEGPEIGAGWRRSSEKAGDYISIQLDDPAFAQPVHAKLFQNGDNQASWSLHWSRRRMRGDKA